MVLTNSYPGINIFDSLNDKELIRECGRYTPEEVVRKMLAQEAQGGLRVYEVARHLLDM